MSFRTWITPWRECSHATDPTSDMHWPVRIFYVVLTVLHAVEATSSASHDQGPGLTANWNDHSMRRSAGGGIPGGRKKLPISLGFKCAYCGGKFGSRADSHSRHSNSIGTPCADSMNSKSISLTQRGDTYTGTLSLHDTLGVWALVLPHQVQTWFCHFATRTLSHQVSCNNVYKVNNGNNSVIIVHNVKERVLYLSGNPWQKIFYCMISAIIHFLFCM